MAKSASAVPQARPLTRVLLLHKGGIGDLVFGLPLMRDLKEGLGAPVTLTVVTHRQGAELLAFAPFVDRVIAATSVHGRSWLAVARVALEAERFDVALTSVRSVAGAYFLWRAGAAVRVGFDTWPERWLYTRRASLKPFEVVFSRRFQRLAQALGVVTDPTMPRLVVPQAARDEAARALRRLGWNGTSPLVGVHIGGGWPTKRWPEDNVVSFGRLVRKRLGSMLVLQGGPADRERAQTIAAALPGIALNTAGNTTSECLAQCALCQAVVGLDSGLSHAAAAAGVPTAHLFGPNDPASLLLASHQRILVHPDLACRPCNRAGRERCPRGHHRCMRELSASQVLNAVETWVG